METNVNETVAVQGRWGWYACEKDTYKKLRRLQYLYLLSLRADAAYNRWARKEPQNRVSHRWVRNAQGQKIHCVRGEPIPEPKGGWKGFRAFQKGYVTLGQVIIADYQKAKYPKTDQSAVEQLTLSTAEIDDLLAKAEAWLAQK